MAADKDMDHFWMNLMGCFTWPAFYASLAEELAAKGKTRGVELGNFAGQSLAYLAVELINRGADCIVDGVELRHYEMAYANLKPVRKVVRSIWPEYSWDAAVHYEDCSLDFVMIDADHSYESVSKDIAAWKPKVKSGGILCGHDYNADYPGLQRAVDEVFAVVELHMGEPYDGPSQRIATGGKYYPVWSVRVD